MEMNGKVADISAMFMNSTTAMIIEANVAGVTRLCAGSTKSEYLEIDAKVEYKPDVNTVITGTVKSAISIQSEDGEIITIPKNSIIKRLSDNFEGITTLNENDNLDILYNALDQQTFTNIINGDGFISTNENDITTTLNSMNINLTPQNGIIDGLAFAMNSNKDLLIEAGNTQPRIDLIVLRKTQRSRTIEIVIKKGEPDANPKIPILKQDNFGVYELPIFKVYVDINQTSLNRLNITNMRNRTGLLGLSNNLDSLSNNLDSLSNNLDSLSNNLDSLSNNLDSLSNNLDSLSDTFVGMIDDYAGDINKLPLSYMICDGRELSRIGKYSKLFDKIGTIWGAGNGISTFNLPDGRGAVAKGAGSSTKYQYDENRGSVGSYQNTAIKNIRGQTNSTIGSLSTQKELYSYTSMYHIGVLGTTNKGGNIKFDASQVVPVGQTNRDNNFAVLKVIYTPLCTDV